MNKKTQHLGFIHRFIPPNKKEVRAGGRGRKAKGKTPHVTLLLLHGTGGNEEDLLRLGHEIAPEAAILSPRGKALENGMPRFFRRLAEGFFNIEDLKFRTYELADFVEETSKVYRFDLQRLVAIGYSNGANIVASALLLVRVFSPMLFSSVLWCHLYQSHCQILVPNMYSYRLACMIQ